MSHRWGDDSDSDEEPPPQKTVVVAMAAAATTTDLGPATAAPSDLREQHEPKGEQSRWRKSHDRLDGHQTAYDGNGHGNDLRKSEGKLLSRDDSKPQYGSGGFSHQQGQSQQRSMTSSSFQRADNRSVGSGGGGGRKYRGGEGNSRGGPGRSISVPGRSGGVNFHHQQEDWRSAAKRSSILGQAEAPPPHDLGAPASPGPRSSLQKQQQQTPQVDGSAWMAARRAKQQQEGERQVAQQREAEEQLLQEKAQRRASQLQALKAAMQTIQQTQQDVAAPSSPSLSSTTSFKSTSASPRSSSLTAAAVGDVPSTTNRGSNAGSSLQQAASYAHDHDRPDKFFHRRQRQDHPTYQSQQHHNHATYGEGYRRHEDVPATGPPPMPKITKILKHEQETTDLKQPEDLTTKEPIKAEQQPEPMTSSTAKEDALDSSQKAEVRLKVETDAGEEVHDQRDSFRRGEGGRSASDVYHERSSGGSGRGREGRVVGREHYRGRGRDGHASSRGGRGDGRGRAQGRHAAHETVSRGDGDQHHDVDIGDPSESFSKSSTMERGRSGRGKGRSGRESYHHRDRHQNREGGTSTGRQGGGGGHPNSIEGNIVVKKTHLVETASGTIEYRIDLERTSTPQPTKAERLPDGSVRLSRRGSNKEKSKPPEDVEREVISTEEPNNSNAVGREENTAHDDDPEHQEGEGEDEVDDKEHQEFDDSLASTSSGRGRGRSNSRGGRGRGRGRGARGGRSHRGGRNSQHQGDGGRSSGQSQSRVKPHETRIEIGQPGQTG